MFGLDTTMLAFVGLATLAACAVVYTLLFDRVSSEASQEKRINRIASRPGSSDVRAKMQSRLNDAAKRRQTVQNTLKDIEDKNKMRDPNKVGLKEQMRQAGISISVKTFAIISVVFGIFCILAALLLGGNLISAAGAGVVGGLGLPRWVVKFIKKRRMKQFTNEFPNAVDVIVRGIKAGLPLNDCIGIVANEAKEPVGSEFKRILETQKLGVPMSEAIQKLHKSVPLTETNFFGIVIAIQQSAGGNLSEALGNLSNVLRDRKMLKAKIQAMSMEAKASAVIIGALPIIVAILVYITSPAYILPLFNTSMGQLILLCSAVWMGLGCLVMKGMINFDF